MNRLIFCFFFLASCSIYFSCKNDKLPEPIVDSDCNTETTNYNSNIKPIIDTYCAIPACHASNGNAPGDFSNYNGMQGDIERGAFVNSVVTLKDSPNDPTRMPPAFSSGPTNISDEDFEIIECWIQLNFPE